MFRDNQPAAEHTAQTAAQHRNVGLDRRGHITRQPVGPQPIGDAVLGDRPSPLEQQDLEQLLRLQPAEVARPQPLIAEAQLERPEHARCHREAFRRHALNRDAGSLPVKSSGVNPDEP
jgi:hypothetical protein